MASRSARGRAARAFALGAALTWTVAAVAAGPDAAAQSGTNLERPPTWRARYDAGAPADRGHVVMRPGWHVNPGPAGIFWDPGRFASGQFAVTSTIFLFPAGQGDPPAEVDAPYGLLLGGRDLDGPRPAYVTFLLRNDGRFRVARHTGPAIDELAPWTTHDAIAVWSEEREGTARNDLVVDVAEAGVTFWVNDVAVVEIPRAAASLDGLVGLRAGEGLSLHVTEIAIGPNRR